MEGGGEAFGGGKAGGAFDPLTFVKRPSVILRLCSLLFAVIVFGCISSQGWAFHEIKQEEICIMNHSGSTCNYGNGVAIIAFLASIGFLIGEFFFEQMSSVKSRKHYVIGDMAFSGLWAFLYFLSFCIMAHQWSKSEEPPGGVGHGNIGGAIFFSFASIFTWAGCAFFSWQRFQTGTEAAFAGMEEGGGANQAGGYQAYGGEGGYSEPPFSQPGGENDFQQVQY